MSDPSSRRQPIDLEEFERRLRGAASEPRAPAKDPLAELARLVGGENQRPVGNPASPPRAPGVPQSAPQGQPFRTPQGDGAVSRPAAGDMDFDFAATPRVSTQQAWQAAPPSAPVNRNDFEVQGLQPLRAPAQPQRQAPNFPAFTPARQDYAPAQAQAYVQSQSNAPQPQLAQDDEYPSYDNGPQLDDDAYAQPPADFGPKGRLPRSRRMIFIGAGAAAVMIVGVGAAMTLRGGEGSRQTPTILANSNPSKVQPPAQADTSASNASMLDKDNADKSGPTRVVAKQEQPIDIQQSARPIAGSGATGTPFGEPKRVRTIAVRPDGTFISSDTATAGSTNANPARPTIPTLGTTANTAVASPSATGTRPGAPLNLTQGATLPQAANQTPSTASTTRPPVRTIPTVPAAKPTAVADATPTGTPDVAPAAKVPARAPAKPTNVAAADTSASTAAGGYAVQIAAAGSESEAKDKMSSLGSKFSSQLSGYHLGYKQGDSNGKSVWRVRVSGMTKEAATSLCTNLKSGGGACFVTAN